MRYAADKRLCGLADEILLLQEQYLLHADGRKIRALIIRLVDCALKIKSREAGGFRAKSQILLAMHGCGIIWTDGLDATNELRLTGSTALEAFAVGLARDIAAGDDASG